MTDPPPEARAGQRIATLADLDKLIGRRVQIGFTGWRHGGHHGVEWGQRGCLGRDGQWLTLDGSATAFFGADGVRDTPYVRVRFLDEPCRCGAKILFDATGAGSCTSCGFEWRPKEAPAGSRAIALVGQPSTLIACVLEELERRGCRTALDPFGRTHPDQHEEVLAGLRSGSSIVTVGVWCPYAVSLFDAEDVWVLAARDGTGHAARLSDHSEWAEWVGKVDPGEFWISAGEAWIFDVGTVTTKIADAIAEDVARG